MPPRIHSLDFPRRIPMLWLVVIWTGISADHLAIGFSSLHSGCSSILSRKPVIAGHKFPWYAVHTDLDESFSTVPAVEETTDTDSTSIAASGRRKRRLSASSIASFEERFAELLEFKEIHGHTRVPRRQGKLGDWVNKLRQRKDRLEDERLRRLKDIEFCWDASDDKRAKEREKWWKKLDSLRESQEQERPSADAGSDKNNPLGESSSLRSKRQSSVLLFKNLGDSQKSWLRRQRVEFISSGRQPSSKLDEKQILALNAIDPKWWQTARERKWYDQYLALKDFRRKHGHCNVTVAHKDKQLFHWVQSNRKKYRSVKLQREDGICSDGSPKLSSEQIFLLDRIDFNWDPWGHYSDPYNVKAKTFW